MSGWQVNPALSQVLLASTLPPSALLIRTSYTPIAATIFSERDLFLTYIIAWPLLDEGLELETFKECPNLGQCLFLLEVSKDRQ